MSDDRAGRLPPPAFPPGSRKHVHRNSGRGSRDALAEGLIFPDDPMPERSAIEDAFISPDDPLPPRNHRARGVHLLSEASIEEIASKSDDDAFISPDEPMPSRSSFFRDLPQFDTDEDVVVTGMGDDPHLDPDELVSGGDPHVMDLIYRVGKLAEALRTKGEAGLRISGDMEKFDATLRGYCVGYLAGRRAEAPPLPEEY